MRILYLIFSFILFISALTPVKGQPVLDGEGVTYDTLTYKNVQYVFCNMDNLAGWIYRTTTWPVHTRIKENGVDVNIDVLLGDNQDDLIRPTNGFSYKMEQAYNATFTPAEREIGRKEDLIVVAYYAVRELVGVMIEFRLTGNNFSSMPLTKFMEFDQQITSRLKSGYWLYDQPSLGPVGERRNYNYLIWMNPRY